MAFRQCLILRACEPFGGPLGPASARPSRQPLRGFLRMRFFLMPSRGYLILRRRTAPSRRTRMFVQPIICQFIHKLCGGREAAVSKDALHSSSVTSALHCLGHSAAGGGAAAIDDVLRAGNRGGEVEVEEQHGGGDLL